MPPKEVKLCDIQKAGLTALKQAFGADTATRIKHLREELGRDLSVEDVVERCEGSPYRYLQFAVGWVQTNVVAAISSPVSPVPSPKSAEQKFSLSDVKDLLAQQDAASRQQMALLQQKMSHLEEKLAQKTSSKPSPNRLVLQEKVAYLEEKLAQRTSSRSSPKELTLKQPQISHLEEVLRTSPETSPKRFSPLAKKLAKLIDTRRALIEQIRENSVPVKTESHRTLTIPKQIKVSPHSPTLVKESRASPTLSTSFRDPPATTRVATHSRSDQDHYFQRGMLSQGAYRPYSANPPSRVTSDEEEERDFQLPEARSVTGLREGFADSRSRPTRAPRVHNEVADQRRDSTRRNEVPRLPRLERYTGTEDWRAFIFSIRPHGKQLPMGVRRKTRATHRLFGRGCP